MILLSLLWAVREVIFISIFAGFAYCQLSSHTLQCDRAVEEFNKSFNGFCKIAYDEILSDERASNCQLSNRQLLCDDGECAQSVRAISCNCHENAIAVNIGTLCDCASSIACPFPKDNCSKAVDAFEYNTQCRAAYLSFVSNGNDTYCSTLCGDGCNNLAHNISCHCSQTSESYQMIKNISSLCRCPTSSCSSDATELLLPSLWILILSLATAMATWWIS